MQIQEHLHLCAVGVTKSFGVVGRGSPFYGDLERGFEHLYGSSKSESAQREAMFGGEGYKLTLDQIWSNTPLYAVSVPIVSD